MGILLGIDVGTSATKALLCDGGGRVLATASAEYPIYTPKPGWSEQEPLDWWKATIRATAAVCAKARIKPSQVTGIGLSGQMQRVLGRRDQAPAPSPVVERPANRRGM